MDIGYRLSHPSLLQFLLRLEDQLRDEGSMHQRLELFHLHLELREFHLCEVYNE